MSTTIQQPNSSSATPILASSPWARMDATGVPLLLARLALGAMMIKMSLSKIEDPVTFMKLIKQYEMLPQSLYAFQNVVVVILPWIELIGGLALILGVLLRGTGVVMLGMLIVFTTAIALRTLSIIQSDGTSFFAVAFDCGCGGGPQIIWKKLMTNSGLILTSCVVIASKSRRFCAWRAQSPSATSPLGS